MRTLTGAWRGLYSYPRVLDPVSFTAQLSHADEWLTGSTAEAAPVGTLAASLNGRVSGAQVTFLKMYDLDRTGYDTVHYRGEMDPDAQEIWGRWMIPGAWSGTFLMIRWTQTQAAMVERWRARA